jgi:hypothetical protein
MSQIANIITFDGAATPVSHTLVPVSVSRKGDMIQALWRELLASVPDYAQVRYEASHAVLKSGVKRSEWKIVVPVMEAILNQNAAGYTAAPKVAFEDTFGFFSYAHPRSTVAGRRLARQLMVNTSGNVSTSVAASTTGPFSELFDSLLMPT